MLVLENTITQWQTWKGSVSVWGSAVNSNQLELMDVAGHNPSAGGLGKCLLLCLDRYYHLYCHQLFLTSHLTYERDSVRVPLGEVPWSPNVFVFVCGRGGWQGWGACHIQCRPSLESHSCLSWGRQVTLQLITKLEKSCRSVWAADRSQTGENRWECQEMKCHQDISAI